MAKKRSFFAELKRRHVYRVAVAYAVVAWLLIQVATQVFPFFEIPNWAVRLVVLLLALGFPVSLILAWAFDITPQGIKRAEDVDPNQPTAKSIGRKFIGLTIAMALIASGLLVFQLLRPKVSTSRDSAMPGNGSEISGKSIAVLPFDNLTADPSTAYFAEGVQNEILTKLAAVRDLKVISRTSTAKYQSRPENLKTVAQELGVATILEGAVQKAGEKIRVNVQLIDARSDSHLWAKSYDRDLKDVLSVESEVAGEITEALKANLSPGEVHILQAVSTRDPEAHDLFLRAEYEKHQAESTLEVGAFDRAAAFYKEAFERDPKFVEAAAGLAYVRLYRHWFITPLAPRELEEVKAIIDHALALAPASPEAHYALGLFFYWGHRQYGNALEEFKRTLELQPNNASAQQFCGWVSRRRGEWKRSLADVQRAQELDPRDPGIPASLGGTYLCLRLWNDAERSERRALALDPHKAEAAALLALTHVNATGNTFLAREAFTGFAEDIRLSSLIFHGDVAAIVGIRIYLDVLERRFDDALEAFQKEMDLSDLGRLQRLTGIAVLCMFKEDSAAARSAAEQALPLLERRFKERPDDTFSMTELSWVYLALGRNADALRLARRAADSMSIEKDAITGTFFQSGLAQIEARAGAADEAIKRLRYLLSIPAGQPVSIARLKIDPVWDPIRNYPGFQQLLLGKELIGPNK